ncbi:MAG: glycosyltransferase family 2 protein [Planctomycetes bacterium]|nr:glycosyltransferase family 2 protein [Planctomycetota bacterium]
MSQQYDVSLILCTYNREHWIGDAIQSLLKLRTVDRLSYEVIVVDNASTDNTPEVIAAIAESADRPVRYVRETRQGPSAARNRGIAEASGEWLAFIDDDERADPDWLLELLATTAEKGVRVSGGAVHLISSEADAQPLPPMLEQVLAPGGRRKCECLFTPKHALNSGNQMLHRSVFEENGAYEESWTEGGEDTELFNRLYDAGVEAWYNPKAIVLHLVPPYRTSAGYIQWLSLRQGWSLARKDVEKSGSIRTVAIAALRGFRSAMLLPLLLVAWLCGDSSQVLYRRSQLWRTLGYVRGTLRSVAPRVFAQEQFLSTLEFRGERQQFA